MAANSKREQIILSDVALLEGLPVITTVKRTVQSYSDLERFAQTQLPVVAVVGGLPVPVNHRETRRGYVDQIISDLRVDIYAYMIANADQDVEVSDMMDEIWRTMYADPSRAGLCMYTRLHPEPTYEYWEPYVALKISCVHQYQHSTEGI